MQSLGNICTVSDDKLTFYFTGFYGNPGNDNKMAMYEQGATGIAFLRRDGFASMDAREYGELLTRKLTFTGKHLFINASAPDGSIKAEILDENGNIFDGFSAKESIPVSGDHTKVELKWQKNTLAALANRIIRIRFIMHKASLYSFWTSMDARGASGGFVAGGGPDYKGPQDI